MLSNTAEYALRTVLYIADQEPGVPVRVDDIAAALGLPRNYLSKILHRLAREGLLRSSRGKGGGFVLARPAARIALIDVVSLFDEMGPSRRCLLGRAQCSDANPCQAHHRWKGVSERLNAFFRETRVADLVGDTSAHQGDIVGTARSHYARRVAR